MPITPTTEISDPHQQNPTPVKARIQGTFDFLESQGIKGKKEEVFRFNNISHITGYRILNSINLRISRNVVNKVERRDDKYKIILD